MELFYPDGNVVIAMVERLHALELKLQGMDSGTVARNAAGTPDLVMEVIDHDMVAREVAANKDLSKALEHGIVASDAAAETDPSEKGSNMVIPNDMVTPNDAPQIDLPQTLVASATVACKKGCKVKKCPAQQSLRTQVHWYQLMRYQLAMYRSPRHQVS